MNNSTHPPRTLPIHLSIPEINEDTCLLELSGLPTVDRESNEVVFFHYPFRGENQHNPKEEENKDDNGLYSRHTLNSIYTEEKMTIKASNFPPNIDGLRVVDFKTCDPNIAEAFIIATAEAIPWPDPIQDTAKELPKPQPLSTRPSEIPKHIWSSDSLDLYGGFITGIFFRATFKPKEFLTLFVSIPYLGLRGQASSSFGSKTLYEYRFFGDKSPDSPPSGKVFVHQTWFLLFDNQTIGLFRPEDAPLANHAPLFPYQGRIGGFQALVNMISNTLTVGERPALKAFCKNASAMEREIQILSEDISRRRDKKDSKLDTAVTKKDIETRTRQFKTYTREFEVLITEASTMQRLVHYQIRNLQDLLHIFQSCYSGPERSPEWRSGYRPHSNPVDIPEVSRQKEQMIKVFETLRSLIEGRQIFLKELTMISEDLERARSLFLQGHQARSQQEIQEEIKLAMDKQGQTISVFTFITTVFLPLGFLCSYYGMNPPSFQDGIHTTREFWAVSGPVTVAITLLISPFLFGKDDEIKESLLEFIGWLWNKNRIVCWPWNKNHTSPLPR